MRISDWSSDVCSSDLLQLEVAIGMPHREIAGVEPAAGEGLAGRPGVLQVALHHHVAAHEDLAERAAVARHGLEGLGVGHHEARSEEPSCRERVCQYG